MPGIAAFDRKYALFGLMGAGGCLVGTIVGELLLLFLMPSPAQVQDASVLQVDVMFLLDATSSMQPQIDGVQKGIIDFASELSNRKLDTRVGLMAFRDRLIGEEPEVLQFDDGTAYDAVRGIPT